MVLDLNVCGHNRSLYLWAGSPASSCVALGWGMPVPFVFPHMVTVLAARAE